MEWDLIEESCMEIDKEFINISEFSKYRYPDSDHGQQTNVILMNYDDFNADLYKSFKYNSQRILALFKVDVPRQTLLINGIQYNNPKLAFKEINKMTARDRVVKKDRKIMRWRKMLYMLCTQAVMYIPCYLLTRTYCNDTYYLGETREHDSMIVDIKQDCVDVSKVLRIFYVNSVEDVTLYRVSFKIHVEFEKCVILSWTVEQ